MSEVTKCDQCEKVVPTGEISKRTITGESGWWKVDSSAFDAEDGADFCSDVCARNFFADRVIAALPEEKRAKDPHEPVREARAEIWDCTRENPCKFCTGEKKPVVHEIDYKAKAHPGVVVEPDTVIDKIVDHPWTKTCACRSCTSRKREPEGIVVPSDKVKEYLK